MTASQKLRVVALVKEAGFWNWADNIASFIPVVGSIKDVGKGIYHTATGQHGKAMGDFAWAGAGLIPGGSFARGGAKLMGTAGAKALGLGARHAGMVGHGLRAGTMAGIGTTGDVAGGMLQPQPAAPAPQPAAPQPPAPANTPWNSPLGPGFNMPNQPQFGAPQPTAFQQPGGYGDPMAGYGGLLRAFAGNGFGTA